MQATDDEEELDEIVGPDGSRPDKPIEEFEVSDPANEVNQQAFAGTDTAFATPGDINSNNGTEGALGQFDSNVARIISVTQSDQLWQQLDGLRDASGNEISLEQITVGTASTATSTLIVGYVIWALRSGMLLSSVLATMPAWNAFDLTSIVAIADRKDEDGESLEDIVDKQTPEEPTE